MAVKGVIINPVLGAVVLSKGIVGLAGINPLGMFCVCVAYRQRFPTLAAFYQSGKQADFIMQNMHEWEVMCNDIAKQSKLSFEEQFNNSYS